MIIDIHTHILTVWGKEPFTEEKLLKQMDELGIEKFVILPIIGPEVPYFCFGTEDVLEVHRRYPDRVIPFCNIDPRAGHNSPDTDFSLPLDKYKEAGCKGLGELTANIYFDEPVCINLFRQCGRAGLPVLFHLHTRIGGSYGLADEINLPRLEKALKECPETIFIGHSPAFWSEISGNVDEGSRGGYPKDPVTVPGKLQELFRKYHNLYGDLSAGSGFNAITRDPEYGLKFLVEFQDRLLFGTDICHVGQDAPIVNFIKDTLQPESETAYKKITETNTSKLLDL